MIEYRVLLADLNRCGKEGRVADWFTLPVDESEVIERFGYCSEEWTVLNYELPIELESELYTIADLNALCRDLEIIKEKVSDIYIEGLLKTGRFASISDMARNMDSIRECWECKDMTDVARDCVWRGDLFGSLPHNVYKYIDYEQIGRELYATGNFYEVKSVYFEIKC